jgi:hypothetical protein
MIAICNIRDEPHYRKNAFLLGLKRAGYAVVSRGNADGPEDLLVLWNYHPATIAPAAKWESQGGTVIVCENGYAGKDDTNRQYYAIAVHGHNGSGWFPVGDEDRLSKLNLTLEPWRNTDGYVLICGQRCIGSPQMASPPNWHIDVARKLKIGGKDVKIRPHPGTAPPPTRLDDDLTGASTCLIWSSSSGIRALCMGVPVVYDAPHWICESAAIPMSKWNGVMIKDDNTRLEALKKMAWGQRSVVEIESGEPFVRIKDTIGEATW